MLRVAELIYALSPCLQSRRNTRCSNISRCFCWRHRWVFTSAAEPRKLVSVGMDGGVMQGKTDLGIQQWGRCLYFWCWLPELLVFGTRNLEMRHISSMKLHEGVLLHLWRQAGQTWSETQPTPLYETTPSFFAQQDVKVCKPMAFWKGYNIKNCKFVCMSSKCSETNGCFSI